ARGLVIQVAAKLTATSANVATVENLTYPGVFSFVVGGIAIAIAFFTIRRDMKKGILKTPEVKDQPDEDVDAEQKQGKYAKLFAILVPAMLLAVVSILIYRAIFDQEHMISGGDATAFMGGTSLILLILSTFGHEGTKGLEKIIEHLREGFYFAVKIFAPVIPIAGFFFLGNPDN